MFSSLGFSVSRIVVSVQSWGFARVVKLYPVAVGSYALLCFLLGGVIPGFNFTPRLWGFVVGVLSVSLSAHLSNGFVVLQLIISFPSAGHCVLLRGVIIWYQKGGAKNPD